MYRPASRFDSRILEKSSRSTRPTWGDNRSFATPLEADDGTRSAPYNTEDSVMERDFEGPRGNNELREAQRLAANFFSSQLPPSSSTPVYRDARHTRTLSPEAPVDRFGSQSTRHYRERDANDEQRWASNHSSSQERYLSSRSVTETEYWDDVDVSGSRSRKREDSYRWEDLGAEYAARKESEYPIHGETEPVRFTKRVDWTGLFRDGREVGAVDSSIGERSIPVYGGRQLPESYLSGQEDLVDSEEALFSSRNSEPHENLRRGRRYLDEMPDALEEYGLGSSVGGTHGASVGGQRDIDWGREPGRNEVRDFWHSGMRSNGLNEFSDFSRGFAEGPATFPSNRANLQMGRRGLMNPKPDYSVRASLTNRDILGIYYGNSSNHLRKDLPRRGGGAFARSERLPYSGVLGPWHGTSRPPGGFERERDDWGPMRKGKKRWPRSPKAGDNPHLSHPSHGKRFKRETEADKLFLMHNSKATSASFNESREKTDQPHTSDKGKEKEERMTPIKEDFEKKAKLEGKPTDKGLWDESWSDSEEEKAAGVDVFQGEETGPTVETPVRELEQEAAQSMIAATSNDSIEHAGDSCVAADDDADWESLPSDTDDQVDGKSGRQDVETEVNRSPSSGNVDVGTLLSWTQSEQANIGKDDAKSIENEDSEMYDADDTLEETRIDTSAEPKICGGAGVSLEKGLAFEAQDAGSSKEDKAYEFYISFFEQNADFRKLYEANVNCGSFECLVCAGVGAKKKKRFPDVTSMVQHAKKIIKTKKLPEHRGFARAVCHILGWDSTVSSPSPKTTVPRGWLAPLEQPAPTTHVNDVTKIQVSSTVAADASWDLESARRLLEEQLKELESDPSVPEGLAQTQVGTGTSESVSPEKEKNIETGDASTTKATVNEFSGHADKANLTEGNSVAHGVNNDIVLTSAEESINEIPDGPEANAPGKPTPTSTINDLDGAGNGPLLREKDGSAKTIRSSVEGLVGDATLVTSGFPVSQGTSNETSKHPAAEVLLNEGYAVPVEGEIQTYTSVAPAPVSKDAGTSFETQTVGESSAKCVAGGTSAFVRFGSPTTLAGTGKVKTSDVSFSVLLAMQGGGCLAGAPPQAEIKPSDAGS